jgi:UMF1 family MFS transporter
MPNLSKGHPKLLNAWAFYDWANSVYSLVIASAVFPIFYELLLYTSTENTLKLLAKIIVI